jgi:hypothetical protein
MNEFFLVGEINIAYKAKCVNYLYIQHRNPVLVCISKTYGRYRYFYHEMYCQTYVQQEVVAMYNKVCISYCDVVRHYFFIYFPKLDMKLRNPSKSCSCELQIPRQSDVIAVLLL